MLLEAVAQRAVKSTAAALGSQVHGEIGGHHREPGEQHEVPRWHVPEPPQRASRGEKVNETSRHADGVESRFGVRANICVQRSAGRLPTNRVGAALAGRR